MRFAMGVRMRMAGGRSGAGGNWLRLGTGVVVGLGLLLSAAEGQTRDVAGGGAVMDKEQLTAAEVVRRMVAALGVPEPAGTVDTFKAGDPATRVTGVVTTFTPTMAVLRRAVELGDNLVVTHEPSFYNHADDVSLFQKDPVYLEKAAYIREHGLVLFRLHDGWHLRQPDGVAEAWVQRAGWERYRRPGEQMFFALPATTLDALTRQLQATFGARVLRVVGDPGMPVRGVAYRPGASGEAKQVKALERDDVDVLVAGEASEWETVEYVRDAVQQGRHKALILLGHETSEEVGMEGCAAWLRGVIPGMRVDFVPAGEPYWAAGAPPTGK